MFHFANLFASETGRYRGRKDKRRCRCAKSHIKIHFSPTYAQHFCSLERQPFVMHGRNETNAAKKMARSVARSCHIDNKWKRNCSRLRNREPKPNSFLFIGDGTGVAERNGAESLIGEDRGLEPTCRAQLVMNTFRPRDENYL